MVTFYEPQLSEADARAMFNGGAWKNWDDEKRAVFQLEQERLCMPFAIFHAAVENVLSRPVFTHEFSSGNWVWIRAEVRVAVRVNAIARQALAEARASATSARRSIAQLTRKRTGALARNFPGPVDGDSFEVGLV